MDKVCTSDHIGKQKKQHIEAMVQSLKSRKTKQMLRFAKFLSRNEVPNVRNLTFLLVNFTLSLYTVFLSIFPWTTFSKKLFDADQHANAKMLNKTSSQPLRMNRT